MPYKRSYGKLNLRNPWDGLEDLAFGNSFVRSVDEKIQEGNKPSEGEERTRMRKKKRVVKSKAIIVSSDSESSPSVCKEITFLKSANGALPRCLWEKQYRKHGQTGHCSPAPSSSGSKPSGDTRANNQLIEQEDERGKGATQVGLGAKPKVEGLGWKGVSEVIGEGDADSSDLDD